MSEVCALCGEKLSKYGNQKLKDGILPRGKGTWGARSWTTPGRRVRGGGPKRKWMRNGCSKNISSKRGKADR